MLRTSTIATAERWRALSVGLGVGEDQRTYHRLLAAWSARSRHYHTLSHLEACLLELDSVRVNAEYTSEVELALWFHDAVYKTYSKRNEERSAEWAAEFLGSQGCKQEAIARVRGYILATQHAAGDLSGDAALVVDIDLAILGKSREIYAEFERNVRKEYWWVAKRRYAKARIAVLNSFLQRPCIYTTPALHAKYEVPARGNLAWAIAALN